MGSFLSSAMEKNFKAQQDFMMENQILMLERNINMQNAMRERMMATQVARMRELLNWTGSFYSLAVVGCVIGAAKSHKPQLIAPLIPLGYIVAYQWDMAYNGKMKRITAEAESIMQNEADLLNVALGMPNIAEIEQRRSAAGK